MLYIYLCKSHKTTVWRHELLAFLLQTNPISIDSCAHKTNTVIHPQRPTPPGYDAKKVLEALEAFKAVTLIFGARESAATHDGSQSCLAISRTRKLMHMERDKCSFLRTPTIGLMIRPRPAAPVPPSLDLVCVCAVCQRVSGFSVYSILSYTGYTQIMFTEAKHTRLVFILYT